ncbi:MAG: polysaccharide pyruvyl transferase family protein [Aeriscardovia sp.]|nr:polysaccharide pyruvyl transferase family protein [Aeriscardovia sp.]
MKVATITLTETPNYGAVLQAYALKEYVSSLGYEYTLLNYENEAQRKKFSFWGTTEFMDWKYSLYKKIQYPINCHRIKKIVSFQHEHGNLSPLVKKDELPAIKEQYDVFICGSDQVWNNPEVNHYDDTFFLRFAEGKNTIAYAASFGKTTDMLNERD